MKKIVYALLCAGLLTACSDYNDNFEGLKKGPQPVDVKKLDYTLTAADYKAIADNATNKALAKAAGEEKELAALAKTGKFTERITASEYLPAFLAAKWFTADNSSAIHVTYEQKVTTGADAFVADFEQLENKTVNPAVIQGWTVTTTTGAYNWESRFRNNNHYLQISAFQKDPTKQVGAAQAYAITPAIAVEEGMHLTFEALYGNYKDEGGRLSLFLLEGETDFAGKNVTTLAWKNLTSSVKIEKPAETYGTFKRAADVDLSKYKGKKVHIAFRYDGNDQTNATTTLQLDNVVVGNKVSTEGTATDQFVLTSDKWTYDPSSTILLYPTKNATTVAYFQAGVDWVKENIDAKLGVAPGKGYVTSYGNNEYYSGLSAHYGNVDIRAGKAREQYAKPFEGMDDAAVSALLEKHLQETLAGALAKLHPDAVPVAGIDVIYTLRIGVYTGTSLAADQLTHEIKFKVVAKGKFEYVENSYRKL